MKCDGSSSACDPGVWRPLQILGLMVVRKMLDMVFSQHDLAWLDDLLPEKEKKKKDDNKKKGKDKDKDKEKKRPRTDDSDDEVRTAGCCCCCPLLEPRLTKSPHRGSFPNMFVCLQDKVHTYSNHSPSSESDLDRRYCVLKLHIPYKDLVYPDVVQSQWGAYCQAAATRSSL